MLFPANTGPNATPGAVVERFDFLGPQSADAVHNWIVRHLPAGEYPQLSRPVNYGRIITIVTIIIGVFTFGTVAYPYILPVIQNRNLWAAISLILVLLFTSGHMYNHIRKVPYVSGNGQGGITYFASGFGNQFGMETQIIAAMCKNSYQFLKLYSTNCVFCRCCPLICFDRTCSQGSSYEGC